ncbi:autolysin regulatory protein [Streptococcus pneumoniae]|nr:autolysin regulatory protein [Streptococcus pneumoniae]
MVIEHVDAEAEVLEIERAVNCIMDPYVRQVITKKYMDMKIQLSDKAIYMDLGYSESEFYRMLSRGALEFAEAYRKGKLIVYRKILGDICK